MEATEQFVKDALEHAPAGHGWDHVNRVRDTALTLAEEEDADARIVEIAALLHDVDDYKLGGADGLQQAASHLSELDVEQDVIEQVLSVIENVSFRGGIDDSVGSIEGAVVQDADRLDAIGAIGIARTFAYGGEHGIKLHDPETDPRDYNSEEEYKNQESTTINHFYEKLLQLKDRMKTDTGRAIAKERHAFMEAFLDRFFTEWDEEDLP